MANIYNNLSSINQHNCQMLLNRERGQTFYTDAQGKLRLVRSIFDHLWYWWKKDSIVQKVQTAVTDVIKELNTAAVDFTPQQKEQIKPFFFDKLSVLSDRVFERKEVGDRIVTILKERYGPVDGNLSPRLQDYKDKVNTVRVAQALGVGFQPLTQGNGGSYIGRDLKGSPLLIFKPADEESLTNSPKLWVRLWNIFKSYFYRSANSCRKPGLAHLAEVAQSRVDEILGTNKVPTTRLEKFKSDLFLGAMKDKALEKEGSCQLWATGASPSKSFIDGPNKISQTELELMAGIDFIETNTDRKSDNWLVKDGQIVLIDNGMGYPAAHPNDRAALFNMYKWDQIEDTQNIRLGETSRQLVAKLTENTVKEIFDAIKEVYAQWTSQVYIMGILAVMGARMTVYKHYVNNNKTLYELAQVRTPDAVQQILLAARTV